VVFGLLGLAASISHRGSLLDTGVAEAAARVVHALIHGAAGAGFIARPILSARARLAVPIAAPLARGLLIAAPIAILLAGMLAAADPVFASFFKLNFDFGSLA